MARIKAMPTDMSLSIVPTMSLALSLVTLSAELQPELFLASVLLFLRDYQILVPEFSVHIALVRVRLDKVPELEV